MELTAAAELHEPRPAAEVFNGIQFGLILFLMAVGVTLAFGIMPVINLAHRWLFMLGGYFLMASLTWTRSYALAIPTAFIGTALVAVLLEIGVLRPVPAGRV